MPFVLTGNLETDTMCRFGMAEIQQGGGVRTSAFDQGGGFASPKRQRRPRCLTCLFFPVTNLRHLLIQCGDRPRVTWKAAFHAKPLRDHQHAAQFPARCQSRTLKGDSP
jgi:hypothetical protein